MQFLNSDVKKYFYWGLAWTFTFVNFTAFIVSRNQFWLTHPGQAWLAASATENRTYLASEFERVNSCYYPPTCVLRSGSAVVSQSLIWVTTRYAEFVTVEINNQQKVFIVLLIGLLWRTLCLITFLFCTYKLFKSLNKALTVTNTLMLVLGGLPLWIIGRIIVNIPIRINQKFVDRAADAFYFMAFQDLIFYDYGLIAMIPLTIFSLSQTKFVLNLSHRGLFLIGIIASTFYEIFVPIIFFSALLFFGRTTKKFRISLVWLFAGQFVWTTFRAISVIFTEANDPSSPFFTDVSLKVLLRDTLSTGASTKGSLPSIFVQLTLIIVVALVSGTASSTMFPRSSYEKVLPPIIGQAISSTTLVTVLLICGSFLRPVYVETGRQSLGLTVAVVIYSFAMTENLRAKSQEKRRNIEGTIG